MTQPKRGKSESSQFKPGNKAGVGHGRPRIPDELKQDIKLNPLITRIKASQMISRYMSMTRDEIQTVVLDPKTSAMELVVAKILAEAIKDGDYSRLNFLLDRTIGKVVDKIEHINPDPITIRHIDGSVTQMGYLKNEEDV